MRSHENLFCIDATGDNKLKNFVTQIYAEDKVAKSRLKFHSITTSKYHKKVYIDKTVMILDIRYRS